MSKKSDFGYSNFDWDNYMRHRPIYKGSFYKLIFDYHAAHANTWDTAHDLGAGIGIVATQFLTRFRHVTVSDPSAEYIAAAEGYVTAAAGGDSSRVAFVTEKAEAPLLAEPGSVDMVTMGEALHWADPPTVLANIGTYLRPGGTTALWFYGTRFVFADGDAGGKNAAVQEAWLDLHGAWLRANTQILSSRKPLDITGTKFDCVHFDPAVWKDVRRVYWLKRYPCDDTQASPLPSMVEDGESLEEREEEDMFELEVDDDAEWMDRYLRSLIPFVKPKEQFADKFKKLQEALGNEGVRRKIMFPSMLLLATKR